MKFFFSLKYGQVKVICKVKDCNSMAMSLLTKLNFRRRKRYRLRLDSFFFLISNKRSRKTANLRGSRVELEEMGDRFATLFEYSMNFPNAFIIYLMHIDFLWSL